LVFLRRRRFVVEFFFIVVERRISHVLPSKSATFFPFLRPSPLRLPPKKAKGNSSGSTSALVLRESKVKKAPRRATRDQKSFYRETQIWAPSLLALVLFSLCRRRFSKIDKRKTLSDALHSFLPLLRSRFSSSRHRIPSSQGPPMSTERMTRRRRRWLLRLRRPRLW